MAQASTPAPATMLPKELTEGSLALDHKPSAKIQYNLVQSTQTKRPKTVIVFLNGLMTVKAVWLPIIAGIISKRKEAGASLPEMLAYDRYGQGLTEDRDPQDAGREPGHGHNVADAADDLYQLIRQISPHDEPNLILVGNSIGCAIARLYAQKHPVAAVLLLDSVLANSDFDIWPNPEKPGFDEKDLPEDVIIEVLKEQRARFIGIFRPDAPNKEGLSRRDLPKLLPLSDGPKLMATSHAPWVTVIGHGFESFAEEGLKMMGTPKGLTMRYTNPYWHEYNQGLVKLTDSQFAEGPIEAKGCGHFIQRDDPELVIAKTLDLLDKVESETA